MKTYYDILNGSTTSSSEELKQAYFACLRIYHPDKGATDLEKFNLLQKAYEVLRDRDQKKTYDLWLKEQKLRADDIFGIVDEYLWCLKECHKAEEVLENIPHCRCCGDNYIIDLEDLDHIIDFGLFDCLSCSVKLKVIKE